MPSIASYPIKPNPEPTDRLLGTDMTTGNLKNFLVGSLGMQAPAVNALISAASINDRDRTNHTGTQSTDTLTDGITSKVFTTADDTKLATIQQRSNHTGTQLSTTISDFTSAVQDVGRDNFLLNPGFEIKQRTASSFLVTGYTLDMWKLNLTGAAGAAVTQIASTIGSAGFSAQIVGVPSTGTINLAQSIENFTQFRNKFVTFAVTIKSSVANSVVITLTDGTTSTSSSANVGTGTETLFITKSFGSTAAQVTAQIRIIASCTAEVNDATLCMGSNPMTYVPKIYADDLATCMRYYEIVDPSGSGTIIVDGFTGGTTGNASETILWKVRKYIVPTVTKVGTWTVSNSGQPTVVSSGIDGCRLDIAAVTGPSRFYAFNNGAGQYLIADSPL